MKYKIRNYFLERKKYSSRNTSYISHIEALRITETAYLAASSSLIWIALYYLPIGGALFRLALPLPLILLQLRRGNSSGFEGVILAVLLLVILMGPVRGPLIIFPYGLLSMWLGWCWKNQFSWWISWALGVLLGTFGFFVRVLVLSLLVGENLWIVITRAGSALIDRFVELFALQISPDIGLVQIVAVSLVILQEIIYVLTLHAVAYWIFPRLKAKMPEPPAFLYGLVTIDPI